MKCLMIILGNKLLYFIIGLIIGITACLIWPCREKDPGITELKNQIDSLQGYNGYLIEITDSLTVEIGNSKYELEKLRNKPFKSKKDTVAIIAKQDEIITKQDTVIRKWEKIHIIDCEIIQGQAEIINRQENIIIKQQKEITTKHRKNQIWKWAALVESGIIIILCTI